MHVMAIREIRVTTRMSGYGVRSSLAGTLYGGEALAHKFIVTDADGGSFSGTVTAKFVRMADDVTVPLAGSTEGGAATVTLTSNCYLKPGRFLLTIFVTENGSTTEVYSCSGNVALTDGETTVDPSGEIALDVSALVAAIDNAVSDIPADYAVLDATVGGVASGATDNAYTLKSVTVSAGYMQTSGTLYASGYYHAALTVHKGERYAVRTTFGADIRAFVLKVGDSVYEYIPASQAAWNTAYNFDSYIYTVPVDGTLYVNGITNAIEVALVDYVPKYADVRAAVPQIANGLRYKILDLGSPTSGMLEMSADHKTVKITVLNDFIYYRVTVKPNTIYRIFGYDLQDMRAWVLTDENGNVLDYARGYDASDVFVLDSRTILTGATAKYLYVGASSLKKSGAWYAFGAIVAEESSETVPRSIANAMNNRSQTFKYSIQSISSSAYATQIIPVYAGEKYFVRSHNYYDLSGVVCIDWNGNVMADGNPSYVAPTSVAWINIPVDVTSDGFLIVSTAKGTDAVYIAKVQDDSCFGKKWYAIGDSFTAFYSDNPRNSQVNYVDYVAGALGLAVTNVGVGGSGYKAPEPGDGSTSYPAKALGCAGYDLVTIFGSFNDIAASLPLGTVTDTGTTTLAGLMYNAINNIRDTEPGATIVVISPAPWISQNSVTGGAWGTIDPDDYVAMLEAICRRYNVPFVDVYHQGGASPWLWGTTSDPDLTYLYDGTHYNALGHQKFIAPMVTAGILRAFRQY